MKSKEELKQIKEEVETLNKKIAELTQKELEQVSGGNLLGSVQGDESPGGVDIPNTYSPKR